MSRPLWQVSLIKKSFPTPIVARLTRLPLVGRLVYYLLFHQDEMVCLPVNESVAQEENVVLPSDVVRFFVKKATQRWIMNECICRSASGCKKYPIDIGCLFLGDATQQINPALGRSVSEAEALSHVDRCQEAGLVHLIGRNKLDSVWLKAKPAHKLLTICNCCDCCCLWKVLIPNACQPIAESVLKLDGVEVRVTERCEGCGTCVDQCFVQAISLRGDRAVISDNCRGCGRCVVACPNQAIHIELPAANDATSALIQRLSSLVEV